MKNKMTYVLYMIALFAFFMASVSYWGNIQLGDRLNAESIGLNLASLMALLSGLLIEINIPKIVYMSFVICGL